MTLTNKIRRLEDRTGGLNKRYRIVDMTGPGDTQIRSFRTDGGSDEDTGDREVVTVKVIYEKDPEGSRHRP